MVALVLSVRVFWELLTPSALFNTEYFPRCSKKSSERALVQELKVNVCPNEKNAFYVNIYKLGLGGDDDVLLF